MFSQFRPSLRQEEASATSEGTITDHQARVTHSLSSKVGSPTSVEMVGLLPPSPPPPPVGSTPMSESNSDSDDSTDPQSPRLISAPPSSDEDFSSEVSDSDSGIKDDREPLQVSFRPQISGSTNGFNNSVLKHHPGIEFSNGRGVSKLLRLLNASINHNSFVSILRGGPSSTDNGPDPESSESETSDSVSSAISDGVSVPSSRVQTKMKSRLSPRHLHWFL